MLILTLWVVALLSLLAYSLVARAKLSVRQERWHRLEVESAVTVDTLAQHAFQRFVDDGTDGVDGFDDVWLNPYTEESTAILPAFSGASLQGENTTISIVASDESGKININEASRAVIVLVADAVGLEKPDEFADAVLDWRDPDSVGAAEDDYYSALTPAYASPDRPLARIEELLYIRGVRGGGEHWFYGEDYNRNGVLDPEEDDGDRRWPPDNGDGILQPGLLDVMTVQGDGTVNVNTASPTVLRAVLVTMGLEREEHDQVISAVLERRRGGDGHDGSYRGSNDDEPFVDQDDLIGVVAGALEGASQERARVIAAGLGVATDAARFQVSVRYPERNFEAGGELLVTRSDGEYVIREWQDW